MNENKTNFFPYRKIPLICPGHIYGQKTNLMGPFEGNRGGGAYIWEEKHLNLQSVATNVENNVYNKDKLQRRFEDSQKHLRCVSLHQ